MGLNRVFLRQDVLDAWLTEDRVAIEGELMLLKSEQQQFRLKTALHFLAELTGDADELSLVGKVKDLDQVAELGGEHCADSVLIGDRAYQVAEGFVGSPVMQEDAVATGGSLADATRAAVGDVAGEKEVDQLAQFFLSNT